jgi:hypothetical protein
MVRGNEVVVEPDGKAIRYRAVVSLEHITEAKDEPNTAVMGCFMGRFGHGA